MKNRLKLAAVAAVGLAYAFTAFAPATVSARSVGSVATSGSFAQEKGGMLPMFIHITVADILHNNPCGPGSQNAVCPV